MLHRSRHWRFAALAFLLGGATLSGQSPASRSATLVAAPVGPNRQLQNLYAGSYALLIGQSRYDERSAWPSLDSVPDELNDVSAVLREQGFTAVDVVMNPTGEQLRRAVEKFIGQYGYNRDNRLVFFFSGHGHTLDRGQRGYFVPRDAPDPAVDEAGFRRIALPMQQISTWAEDIVARHALFAFDSCFSGTIFRSRANEVPEHLTEATAKPVREFLTAGSAGEKVPARSVFTPMLIRGLRGSADLDKDGFVTGTELGNYVQREVIQYRTNQTPQFGKMRDPNYDEGDVVFVAGSAAPAAASATAPPAPAVVRSAPSPPPASTLPPGTARPAYTSRPAAAMRTSRQAQWLDAAFIRSADESQVFIPLRIKVSSDLLRRPSIAMYVHAVPVGASGASDAATPFQWDSIELRSSAEVRADGGLVQAPMTAPAGEYRVFVALKAVDAANAASLPPTDKRIAEATHDLLSAVDVVAQGGNPKDDDVATLVQSIEVPAVNASGLTTSSILLLSEVTTLTAPLTPEEQRKQPYTLGTARFVPLVQPLLRKSDELSFIFWIYNATYDASSGKPDVTVSYSFYQIAPGQRQFFNRTTPQELNGSTLQAFNAARDLALPSGVSVPLASFVPGAYELEVKVHDNRVSDEVLNTVTFTVAP